MLIQCGDDLVLLHQIQILDVVNVDETVVHTTDLGSINILLEFLYITFQFGTSILKPLQNKKTLVKQNTFFGVCRWT